MQKNDEIVVYLVGMKLAAICKVVSDYYYDETKIWEDGIYPHRVQIEQVKIPTNPVSIDKIYHVYLGYKGSPSGYFGQAIRPLPITEFSIFQSELSRNMNELVKSDMNDYTQDFAGQLKIYLENKFSVNLTKKRSHIFFDSGVVIHIRGSKIHSDGTGFYYLQKKDYEDTIKNTERFFVIVYGKVDTAFVIPSEKLKDIFEGQPAVIRDNEEPKWYFDVFKNNDKKHFLRIHSNSSSNVFDIENYLNKWEQIPELITDIQKKENQDYPIAKEEEVYVFVTGYNEENLQISKKSHILGWARNSNFLSENSLVFVFDNTNLNLDSCFRIVSKLYNNDELIWADEIRSNKIIYPNRWNAEVIQDNLKIPLADINRIPPFDKEPFQGLLRGNFPMPLNSPQNKDKYAIFRKFITDKLVNYWIFIVTDQPKIKLSAEEIYRTRMNDKFWGLNDHTPFRKQLKKEDLVVFCHGARKFLGTAKLETNCFELSAEQRIKFSHDNNFYKPNFGVMLSEVDIWQKPKEVSEYIQQLSFVSNVNQYPVYFQGGIKKIKVADYYSIIGLNNFGLIKKHHATGFNKEDLSKIIQQFKEFLYSENGKKHLEIIEKEKTEVKQLVEKLNTLDKNSQDFIDLILYGLLPYSKSNYARRISTFPVFKNIKLYFKNYKYAEEDWKIISHKIYDLIKKFQQAPNELEQHIKEFISDNIHSRSFQSGSLSPVLFCINDSFPVINDRVVHAYDDFSSIFGWDDKMSQKLEKYTENIEKCNKLISALDCPEIKNFTNFDLFCYWYTEYYKVIDSEREAETDKLPFETSILPDKESVHKTVEPNLWLIRAGDSAQGAPTAIENNFVDIGYGRLPELHKIKDFETFKEHFKKTHPEDNKYRIGQVVPQIWNFIYEIKRGDFVALPTTKDSKLIAVGKIVGEYQYEDLDSENQQYRPVHWLKKEVNIHEFDPQIQQRFNDRGTVRHIGGLDVVNKLKDMLKRLGVNEVDLENINDVNNKLTPITTYKNDYDIENKWLSLKAIDIEEITEKVLTAKNKRLEIDKNVVKRILSHLMVSKHVILVGPPGTGKTDLARRILRELGNKILNNPEPIEAVASYEWGRYEVIGGRSITSNEQEGSFHFGCVTNAIYKQKFLLIDEFNRADMNKAFGEMFLALDHGEIQLREDEYISDIGTNKKILIPINFRMICTMNDYDKSLLNELSYGLLRRFAFVEINVPHDREKVKKIVLERTGEKLKYLDPNFNTKKVDLYIDKFIDFMFSLKSKREIGLASYIDVVSYLIYSSTVMKNDPGSALNDSLIDYILPQFDRLDIETLRLAYENASKIFMFQDENGKTIESSGPFLFNLKKRIMRLEDLDKLFKLGEAV